MRCLGLAGLANCLMPRPGSKRGYVPGALLQTFMLKLHEGGRCLDDAREMHCEQPLMKLLRLKRIPGARTLGNALLRVGHSQPAQQAFWNLTNGCCRRASSALYRAYDE